MKLACGKEKTLVGNEVPPSCTTFLAMLFINALHEVSLDKNLISPVLVLVRFL